MSRVLVVDDAEFVRTKLTNMLRHHGHEVVEAANGQEAVDRYRAANPNIVLMDITMPIMDGIQAAQAIRAMDRDARIVICSALGQQRMVLDAIRAGAKDFIVKPYSPDRVLDAVLKWKR
ncbi:MAG: response regulator [Clostridia bacterium]